MLHEKDSKRGANNSKCRAVVGDRYVPGSYRRALVTPKR